MAEFLTAVRHGLPVKVVVNNNNSLRPDPLGADDPRLPRVRRAAPAARGRLRRLGPRLRRLRRQGHRARRLPGAVRDALAHPGPALVDCDVNPNEPPMPGKVEYEQAKPFTEAFLRGQPHKAATARHHRQGQDQRASVDDQPSTVPAPVAAPAPAEPSRRSTWPRSSATCARRSTARSGSTPGRAAPTRRTPPTSGRCRSASSCRARSRPAPRRWRCAAATARRCCPAAAAPAWPGSARTPPSSSTGRSTATGCSSRRRGRADLRRRAGHRARPPERPAARARPGVRAGARHPRPLHARRDDRQQLLRRDGAAHGQGGRQRRARSRCCSTTAPACGSARPPTRSTSAISRGRPAGRDLPRSCGRCATSYLADLRTRYPDIPRRVSGYNLDCLLPEKGFHVAQALVGSEGTLRHGAAGRAEAGAAGAGAHRWCSSATPTSPSAADAVPAILPPKPIALEGLDDKLIDFQRRSTSTRTRWPSCPRAAAWLLVQMGGDTPEEADAGRRRHAATRLGTQRGDDDVALFDDPALREGDVAGPRVGPRRHRPGARPARHLAGLGGLGGRRRPTSATTCATC